MVSGSSYSGKMDFFSGSVPRKHISFCLDMSTEKESNTPIADNTMADSDEPQPSTENAIQTAQLDQANIVSQSSGSSGDDINQYALDYVRRMESQTDIPISTIAEENPFETGVTAKHTFVFTQSPSSRYVGLLGVQSRIGSPPRSRTSCLMNKLKLPSSCSSLVTSWTTETVLHRDSGHSDRIYWRIILCCVASVEIPFQSS